MVYLLVAKQCVAESVNNMQNNGELTPLEIVEMFVTVFCFLKDSSEVNQTLLEDFRCCDGYIFLIHFLLKLEEDPREETVQALRWVIFSYSLTKSSLISQSPFLYIEP